MKPKQKKKGGTGIIEVVSHGENATGFYMSVREYHQAACETKQHMVQIYSPLSYEIGLEAKQLVANITHQIRETADADFGFAQKGAGGLKEDILIYQADKGKDEFQWFYVSTAKSYFGDAYFDKNFGVAYREEWKSLRDYVGERGCDCE